MMKWPRSGNNRRSAETDEDKARRARHDANHEIPFEDADPESGEISIDDLDLFVIPARDDKGVGMTVTIHIPPYLERQIGILVASRRFPYLRPADLIRHAITRHCGWLMDIRRSIPQHMSTAIATIMDMYRDADFHHQVEAAFGRQERLIGQFLSQGERVEAIRLYVRVRARAMEAEECSWKRKFLKELDDRYSSLTQAERRLSIVSEGERTEDAA